MRLAICDDERKLRSSLRRTLEIALQLSGEGYSIDEYSSGEALLQGMKKAVPDILFLDIEMEGLNGMDTAKELRKVTKDTVIIFVTAYPDFVFQGYEVHAFHYILKPYKEEKIKEVLQKAVAEMELGQEQYYLIEQRSGISRVALKQVLFFRSEGHHIDAVEADETTRFYGKLGEVEEEMPSYFIRVHNRYLVNLRFVTDVSSNELICGGEPIPVSRAYKQKLAVAFAKSMLK